MENENKTAQNNHTGKKKHFPKRKSYFIEPPQNKNEAVNNAPAQNQPKAEQTESGKTNAERPQHHNHRPSRHGGHNRNEKNLQAENTVAPELKKTDAPAADNAHNGDQAVEKKQNPNNSNKKRNKKKNKFNFTKIRCYCF